MDDKSKQQEKETDYSVSGGIKTRQRRRWDALRGFTRSSLPPSCSLSERRDEIIIQCQTRRLHRLIANVPPNQWNSPVGEKKKKEAAAPSY